MGAHGTSRDVFLDMHLNVCIGRVWNSASSNRGDHVYVNRRVRCKTTTEARRRRRRRSVTCLRQKLSPNSLTFEMHLKRQTNSVERVADKGTAAASMAGLRANRPIARKRDRISVTGFSLRFTLERLWCCHYRPLLIAFV